MAPRTRSTGSRADVEQDNDCVSKITVKRHPSTRQKDKVYRKETPPSEMRQVRFPARSTTVRPKRTYGKKQRHSLPPITSNHSGKRKDEDPRQSTLTQIGWVPSTFPEDDDELEPLAIDSTADDGASDHKGGRAKSTGQSSKRKMGGKRRKTMGDLGLEDNEKDEDMQPKSSFHTQTLTQMPSWRQSGEEEDIQDMFIGNYGDELDEAVVDGEAKPSATPPLSKRKRSSPQPSESKQPSRSLSQGSAALQTPAKQRIAPAEIPSSQPSPFTPNLTIEQRGWSPLAEGTDRSPLKNRSTNVGVPTPLAIGRVLKRTRSDIPDSYSTVNGGINSTPTTKRTPLKDITPWEGTADATAHQVEPSENASNERRAVDEPTETPQQRTQHRIIVDSDEEFEMIDEELGAPGTPTPVRLAPVGRNQVLEAAGSPPAEAGVQSPLAGLGSTDACQRLTKKTVVAKQFDVEKSSPTSLLPQEASPYINTRPIQDPSPLVEETGTEPETQTQRGRRPSSSSMAEKETPLSSPQKTSPALPPISQLGYKSQGFESQRVPFEVIRQMAPQTDRSDVILSIHPEHVKEITDGTKTHEFRNYKIPQTVARIWIYITRPVCQLKYMAIIGESKLPGQIRSDDLGVGNKDFNEEKGSKFAYELKQVYQLNNPVSLAQMKENGWVEEAPVRYVYVPPAVLGELMGNLQRALFLEPGEVQQPTQLLGATVSQEVEEQLRSDIAHSTQLMRIASSPRPEHAKTGRNDVVILSSSPDVNTEENEEDHVAETPTRSAECNASRQVAFAKPTIIASSGGSQLSLVEDSPPLSTTRGPSSRAQQKSAVRASQATTASASSQSQRLSSRLNRSQGQHLRDNDSIQPLSPYSQNCQTPQAKKPSTNRRLPDLAVEDDDHDVLVVDDSPVVPRARCDDHERGTQVSSWGLGPSLASSSQAFRLAPGGEQDSLMDDSRIRRPPNEIAWDSDGEELE